MKKELLTTLLSVCSLHAPDQSTQTGPQEIMSMTVEGIVPSPELVAQQEKVRLLQMEIRQFEDEINSARVAQIELNENDSLRDHGSLTYEITRTSIAIPVLEEGLIKRRGELSFATGMYNILLEKDKKRNLLDTREYIVCSDMCKIISSYCNRVSAKFSAGRAILEFFFTLRRSDEPTLLFSIDFNSLSRFKESLKAIEESQKIRVSIAFCEVYNTISTNTDEQGLLEFVALLKEDKEYFMGYTCLPKKDCPIYVFKVRETSSSG